MGCNISDGAWRWRRTPAVKNPDALAALARRIAGDGMPNRWEAGRGLNPDDAADGALDPDADGYTNLEDYLNWLAAGNTLN